MSARSLDRRVLILLAICAVLVVTYSIIRGATGTSDFKNPYRVARIFWETGALDIRGEPRYPPTVRVLLAPLAALPLGVAALTFQIAKRYDTIVTGASLAVFPVMVVFIFAQRTLIKGMTLTGLKM